MEERRSHKPYGESSILSAATNIQPLATKKDELRSTRLFQILNELYPIQFYGFIVGDGIGVGVGSAGIGVPKGVGPGIGVGVGVGSEGFFGDVVGFGIGVGVVTETAFALPAANVVSTDADAIAPKNTNSTAKPIVAA